MNNITRSQAKYIRCICIFNAAELSNKLKATLKVFQSNDLCGRSLGSCCTWASLKTHE